MLDHLVLLPGLDGTGQLFGRFLEGKPARFTVDVKEYPLDAVSYDDLESQLSSDLPEGRPFWLVAESFSGPLAVRLGARGLSGLLGIILVCSFVRSPRPFWLRVLPWGTSHLLLQTAPVAAWSAIEHFVDCRRPAA